MFVCVWNGQQALTQKRDGPNRAGRVLQPQTANSTMGVNVERCSSRPQRRKKVQFIL
jgi:hypothetical protein